MYIILLNLGIVFFLINFIIKYFKKILMSYFAISYIIICNTTIILNILNKVGNSVKLKKIKH